MSSPVILVVAAHPDDEVLGCGGTLARLSSSCETHIVILGEGISSRSDRRSEADPAALEKLWGETRAVGGLLGARSVTVEGLPDNRFDEPPLLEVVKRVERIVERLKPGVVYTHHPGDLNIDHAITFRAVMTATRPQAGCPVREVYTFEVASSTEWAFQQVAPSFRPNVFVDIRATLETKIKAMTMYESEVRAFPHPRSPEALRIQAQRWGSVAGLGAAEAFELVRSIRP